MIQKAGSHSLINIPQGLELQGAPSYFTVESLSRYSNCCTPKPRFFEWRVDSSCHVASTKMISQVFTVQTSGLVCSATRGASNPFATPQTSELARETGQPISSDLQEDTALSYYSPQLRINERIPHPPAQELTKVQCHNVFSDSILHCHVCGARSSMPWTYGLRQHVYSHSQGPASSMVSMRASGHVPSTLMARTCLRTNHRMQRSPCGLASDCSICAGGV